MSGKELWNKVFSVVPGPIFPMIGDNLEFEMDKDTGAESHLCP